MTGRPDPNGPPLDGPEVRPPDWTPPMPVEGTTYRIQDLEDGTAWLAKVTDIDPGNWVELDELRPEPAREEGE